MGAVNGMTDGLPKLKDNEQKLITVAEKADQRGQGDANWARRASPTRCAEKRA